LPNYPDRRHCFRLKDVLAVGVIAVGVLSSISASAHDLLRRSVPQAGGVVQPGPLAIALEFSGRIDHDLSELVLVRPDGATLTLTPGTGGAANVLSSTAEVLLGRHILRWTVMSSDGHLTRGTVPFEVDRSR